MLSMENKSQHSATIPDNTATNQNSSDPANWRTQLSTDGRQRIVYKIMDTLKRHLPISVPEGLNELQKIAIQLEEKIYSAATNPSDCLRKISLKMLSMENGSQHNGSTEVLNLLLNAD